MNSADHQRFYRAAFTYHPHINTLRGERGAWRVRACFENFVPADIRVRPGAHAGLELQMDVPRMLKVHTFVNPTKLLRKLFEQRRRLSV